MFGTHFYHKRVRTAVSVFGSLFNNLYVIRKNSSNEVISQAKVPLSYAPKRNFLQRIQDMNNGEDAERRVAIKLPRMSFEITQMTYDAERQLPKTNNISTAIANSINSRQKLFTSTPYNISFQLNVYAKSQDDALQIVEQVLPFFTPQYTVTVKPFSDIATLTEDVPITLTGVQMQDDFEGAIEQRRTIVYSLDFDMKIAFHGPLNDGKIIRDVRNEFFIIGAGLADSDEYLQTLKVTPNPISVSMDSDFGFTETILDSDGS